MTTKRTPYQFFFTHASYSYGPDETPIQGRRRCAAALAYHEDRARAYECSFEWGIDRDGDSSDFSDEKPAWLLWECIARDSRGRVFASLGGIDFGREGEPWDQPYRRVVEAELAFELPSQEGED